MVSVNVSASVVPVQDSVPSPVIMSCTLPFTISMDPGEYTVLRFAGLLNVPSPVDVHKVTPQLCLVPAT